MGNSPQGGGSKRFPRSAKLQGWAGGGSSRVLYDSDVDRFTTGGMFEKIKDRPHVAVVAFTTDGDVFGGCYSIALTKTISCLKDPTIFAFSFESHGRCKTPQRFPVKKFIQHKANIRYGNWVCDEFIAFKVFRDGYGFLLGNERTTCQVFEMAPVFEGVNDAALAGEGREFHCCRLIAVQFFP